MSLLPGPGNLAVSGAGLPTQAAAVESPLPGGVATVVRFLLNLPAWFQITGFIVGALVALALVWFLWRRRQVIMAWVTTRPRNVQIWLTAAAGAVVLFGAGFGAVSWNYTQHDNDFCTGCHVMDASYARFTQSEHSTLSCHDCHQQSIVASMRQLYLWVAERPQEIGPHARVPNEVCAKCHVTGEREVWQRIAFTAGHRTHLESDASALRNVQCVTCHGVEVHRFAPVNATCAQANCHVGTGMELGGMAGQTALHCVACHQFTAEVPRLATREDAAGVLVPGLPQCFTCHEMRAMVADFDPARDPHRGTCGMCHNPHTQRRVAEARGTCATAGCHADWRARPFHVGPAHRAVGQQCTLCHLPHQARVDASDCAGCHRAVAERDPRRRAPPVPFDTARALRRISWLGPHDDARGKGDAAPPFDEPPPPSPVPVSPSRVQPDTFPHDRHKQLSCLTCHVTPRGPGRLTFEKPRGCQICHHQRPGTSDCGACHAAEARTAPRDIAVRVTVAGHPPRNRPVAFHHATHEMQRCVACHTTPVTLDVDPAVTCRSCHEDHHAASRTCGVCHGGADPRAAHAELADAHVRCDRCHAETVALLTPNRLFCQTCHAAQQEHYADRECTVCHFLASPDEFRTHLRSSEGNG